MLEHQQLILTPGIVLALVPILTPGMVLMLENYQLILTPDIVLVLEHQQLPPRGKYWGSAHVYYTMQNRIPSSHSQIRSPP